MTDSVNFPLSSIERENTPQEVEVRSADVASNAEHSSLLDTKLSTAILNSNNATVDEHSSRRFGLQPRDQLFVGVLAGLMLLLSGIHAFRASRWSLQPVELSHHPEREWEFSLDINSANWVEWMQLEGIGERLAVRIVEDREMNGPFRSIEDLDRVKGIGFKTIERLRPHLRCEPVE
ncbi:MAG: helix-hairpin-helix domain-containing protein [Planctomycetota bacterium]|nr:helix-hairpin-helix domain-containing protein [Planctomycetota bacterium]